MINIGSSVIIRVRISSSDRINITPPSLEEVRKTLSVKSVSQSVKEEEDDSIAMEPHLNERDLKRADCLRRYARLRSCFVNNTGD